MLNLQYIFLFLWKREQLEYNKKHEISPVIAAPTTERRVKRRLFVGECIERYIVDWVEDEFVKIGYHYIKRQLIPYYTGDALELIKTAYCKI